MPPGPAGLRIVHVVVTANFGGVERYLTYVAPEQQRRGHHVTVIGGDPRRMGQELAGSGVGHHDAPTSMLALASLLRGPRPAIVHAHMTAADLVAVAAKPILRCAVVSTLHFAKPRGSSEARRVLWSQLPRWIDRQVAISDFVAGAAGQPCVVIPNGVLPHLSRSEVSTPKERIALVVQRLEEEKDTASALRAWQRSGLGGEGWVLEVAGEGSQGAKLRALARDLGIEASVQFLGMVDDVGDRMARAAVLLATAPAEPFGLAVVEAMAARLPVVVARGGAHVETVGPVGGARLFPPGDVDEAARQLRSLAADPDARIRYGSALRRRYEEHYTVGRHVDALDRAYESALGA